MKWRKQRLRHDRSAMRASVEAGRSLVFSLPRQRKRPRNDSGLARGSEVHKNGRQCDKYSEYLVAGRGFIVILSGRNIEHRLLHFNQCNLRPYARHAGANAMVFSDSAYVYNPSRTKDGVE
jgi:hypothetical protein